MEGKTRKIVMAALLAAYTCVTTMIIKIPSPLKGYLNLGDGIVMLAGWTLSPTYGFVAAGIGSGLADILSGYVIYAPVTFIIKGLMALVAFWGFKLLNKKISGMCSRIICCVVAESIMILGYYVFEGIIYGFAASVVNIPANAAQGVAGAALGIVLIKVFEKSKIML